MIMFDPCLIIHVHTCTYIYILIWSAYIYIPFNLCASRELCALSIVQYWTVRYYDLPADGYSFRIEDAQPCARYETMDSYFRIEENALGRKQNGGSSTDTRTPRVQDMTHPVDLCFGHFAGTGDSVKLLEYACRMSRITQRALRLIWQAEHEFQNMMNTCVAHHTTHCRMFGKLFWSSTLMACMRTYMFSRVVFCVQEKCK